MTKSLRGRDDIPHPVAAGRATCQSFGLRGAPFAVGCTKFERHPAAKQLPGKTCGIVVVCEQPRPSQVLPSGALQSLVSKNDTLPYTGQ
jgi:hypothetical protein